MRQYQIAAFALLVASANGWAQIPSAPPPPQIVTSAQAEVRVKPDHASITIGTQTRASTAAIAAANNAKRQAAIIDAVKARGVQAQDITTSNYNVIPETRYREGQTPVTTSFLVSNDVILELKSIDLVGPVIDAALGAGANQINSLAFSVSNADSARRQALGMAVAKARADAEVMAAAAGGFLGSLLELTSTEIYQPPVPRPVMAMARMEADQSTPVEAGEQAIRAMVSARWSFVARTP